MEIVLSIIAIIISIVAILISIAYPRGYFITLNSNDSKNDQQSYLNNSFVDNVLKLYVKGDDYITVRNYSIIINNHIMDSNMKYGPITYEKNGEYFAIPIPEKYCSNDDLKLTIRLHLRNAHSFPYREKLYLQYKRQSMGWELVRKNWLIYFWIVF